MKRTPVAAAGPTMPAGPEPTARKPKPKMVRKVPQRDGLAKMAKEMSKRFGG